MVAGDDITVGAEDVIREAHDTLAAYGSENNPTLLQVKSALLGAWRETQNRVGAAAVLNPLGLTLPVFLKTGRDKLGDVLFLDLARQLEIASRLQCQLLVSGFDDRGHAHFLALDDDAGCRDFTRNGFLSIGSGHTSALASLAFHDYDPTCAIELAIYQVCAAKFMSERAPGVGKKTHVFLQHGDGSQHWVAPESIAAIRALWEKSGCPKTPDTREIVSVTDENVKANTWLMPSRERLKIKKLLSPPTAPRSLRLTTRGRKRPPPSQE
jgi:hypothetical protein